MSLTLMAPTLTQIPASAQGRALPPGTASSPGQHRAHSRLPTPSLIVGVRYVSYFLTGCFVVMVCVVVWSGLVSSSESSGSSNSLGLVCC